MQRCWTVLLKENVQVPEIGYCEGKLYRTSNSCEDWELLCRESFLWGFLPIEFSVAGQSFKEKMYNSQKLDIERGKPYLTVSDALGRSRTNSDGLRRSRTVSDGFGRKLDIERVKPHLSKAHSFYTVRFDKLKTHSIEDWSAVLLSLCGLKSCFVQSLRIQKLLWGLTNYSESQTHVRIESCCVESLFSQ